MMKPPPVIQQPPADGGSTSLPLSASAQAPFEGFVPGTQFGTLSHASASILKIWGMDHPVTS